MITFDQERDLGELWVRAKWTATDRRGRWMRTRRAAIRSLLLELAEHPMDMINEVHVPALLTMEEPKEKWGLWDEKSQRWLNTAAAPDSLERVPMLLDSFEAAANIARGMRQWKPREYTP